MGFKKFPKLFIWSNSQTQIKTHSILLKVVIPVTRRVRFVGKYVTGRRIVFDPIKYIYS